MKSLSEMMTRVKSPDETLTNANIGSAREHSFVEALLHSSKTINVKREDVVGKSLVDVAVKAGICKSKSEARRLIASGGLYICNFREEETPANAPA